MSAPEDLDALAERHATVEQPWPGLLAFGEADRDFFFGRDTEAEDLLDLVTDHRFTTLYGLSGLGKTSLLNAGLFPRLRQRGFLPVRLRLDLEPKAAPASAQILTALLEELQRTQSDAPPPRSDESIWEYLHRTNVLFWTPRHRPLTPVIVLDQFEEVFSRLSRNPAERERRAPIVDLIGDLIEGRVPDSTRSAVDRQPLLAERFNFTEHRYRLLIALREDYLPDFDELASSIPSLHRSRLRLGPMRGSTALRAILAASRQSDILSQDVAVEIVKFIGESATTARHEVSLSHLPIEPALLSVVCRELNEERIRNGRPTINIEQLDTREAILRRFYETGVEGSPEGLLRFLEDRLVTSDGMREMVAEQTMMEVPGVAAEDIQRLIRRRVLRTEYRDGRRLLELTHDRLAPVVLESRLSGRRRSTPETPRLSSTAGMFWSILTSLNTLNEPRLLSDEFSRLALQAIAICGADRALLLVSDGDRFDVQLARSAVREVPARAAVEIAEHVAKQVLRNSDASVVLNANTSWPYASVHLPDDITSIVAVPLVLPRRGDAAPVATPVGVLYLDSQTELEVSGAIIERVQEIAGEMAAGVESARLYRIVGQQERAEHELRVAAEMQRTLLPNKTRKGSFCEAATVVLPSRNITADFFEYMDFPDGSFGFVLCDVSGKGPAAALLTARIQGMLAVQVSSTQSPAEIVRGVNRALCRRAVEAKYATLFFGRLTADGRLNYCNAGHNPPILLSREAPRHLEGGGMPIGFFEHAPFADESVLLEPGSMLVVFTDGVSEALNVSGEEFGEERILKQSVASYHQSAEEAVTGLTAKVREFIGEGTQYEDLTAMVVRYVPPNPDTSTSAS